MREYGSSAQIPPLPTVIPTRGPRLNHRAIVLQSLAEDGPFRSLRSPCTTRYPDQAPGEEFICLLRDPVAQRLASDELVDSKLRSVLPGKAQWWRRWYR